MNLLRSKVMEIILCFQLHRPGPTDTLDFLSFRHVRQDQRLPMLLVGSFAEI